MKQFTTKNGSHFPLLNLKGKDYLEVKYRIQWFREDHPEWSIESEFVRCTEDSSMAKATIRDETGRIRAQAHKTEDKKGFFDHAEKAETGAIGRALAFIGFGTQFCAHDLDEGERIVDAPVQRTSSSSPAMDFFNSPPETTEDEWPPSLPPSGTVKDAINRLSQAVKSAPHSDNPAEYTVKFGKFMNTQLKDHPDHSLSGYVKYLQDSAQKTGKPVNGNAREFIEKVEEYLSTRLPF